MSTAMSFGHPQCRSQYCPRGYERNPVASSPLFVHCSELASIPSVGVDPEAVNVGLAGVTLFRRAAEVGEHLGSDEFLFNSMVRGASGDVLRGYNEAVGARKSIREDLSQWLDLYTRTRAFLSQKYNIDFNAL